MTVRRFSTRRPTWHGLLRLAVALVPVWAALAFKLAEPTGMNGALAAGWIVLAWLAMGVLLPNTGKTRIRDWLTRMEQAITLADFENLLQPPIAVERQPTAPWIMVAVGCAALAAVGTQNVLATPAYWLLVTVALAVVGLGVWLLLPTGPAYVLAADGLRFAGQCVPWAEIAAVRTVGTDGDPTALALSSRTYVGQSWELEVRELAVAPRYSERLIRTTVDAIDRILACPFDASGMELDPSQATDRGEDFLRHVQGRQTG